MQQASTAGALDDRSLNRRVRRTEKTLVASSDNLGTRRGVPPRLRCEADISVSLTQRRSLSSVELVLDVESSDHPVGLSPDDGVDWATLRGREQVMMHAQSRKPVTKHAQAENWSQSLR